MRLLLCFLLLLAGCKSSGVGYVAAVQEADSKGMDMPRLLVRYDGNTFLAWAAGSAQAEIYNAKSEQPVYGPVIVAAGTFIVKVRSTKESWHGKVGGPLPEAARVLLRESEVLAWGVVFSPAPVTGVLLRSPVQPTTSSGDNEVTP